MYNRSCSGIILLALLVVPLSLSFSGEVYHWTDEKGTVHFTDDIAKVPRHYLDQVKKSDFPEGSSGEEGKSVESEKDESRDRVKKYLEIMEKKIETRKVLEEAISKLEEEMKVSQERIKEIERCEKEFFNYYQPVKDPKSGKWVPVGSPYYEEKRRLTAQIEALQRELDLLEEKLLAITRSL